MKNIWFVVETIPQNHPLMMGTALQFMVQEWPKRGLGNKVKNYFTWFEKDVGKMCYVRPEFDAQAEFLASKMLQDPVWTLGVINDVKKWSAKFFQEARVFRELNFVKLSNQELIEAWLKPLQWQRLSHGIGASISWNADADKERVTKGLLAMLTTQVKKQKLKIDPAVAFSILSTPHEESALKQEERDLLTLVIQQSGQKALLRHAQKHEWLNYQYKGPVYDFHYFYDRYKCIKPPQARKLLAEMASKDDQTKKEQGRLMGRLKFDQHQTDLIKMAQALVFIKDYRKEALYHGMYSYEPFLRELGKRFDLSIDQVRAMHDWEIISMLKKSRVVVRDLNQRLKTCAVLVKQNDLTVLTGAKLKTFLAKLKWEKVKRQKSNQFEGTCAYPGKVRGRIKIINIPEQVSKMKQGDILVAHNTNPNLIPAMKMAAALISGAGGLTCHTAIVARELRIPSVVGVTGIDKILKDGDTVEVDANNGTIKKI